MLVTAWILLIIFGMFSFTLTIKTMSSSVNIPTLLFMIFSILVASLAAGVIFGGLILF